MARPPFEEVIAWELSRRWPLTAIGDPLKGLASLGAAREHLPTAGWQDEVVRRMGGAELILATIGTGKGFSYELDKLAAGDHLGRVVFLFPPLDGAELTRRWAFVVDQLARSGAIVPPLPAHPGAVLHTTIGPTTIAVVSDRRDEAAYQAGLRLLLEHSWDSSRQPAFPAPGARSRLGT